MAAPIRKSAKRWLTCCGICGVVSVVLGGCLWLILAPVIVDIIVQLNFITSTESDLYPTFVQTWSGLNESIPDEVPAFELFWLYDLTNSEAVLQGEIPNFVEVGPFTYRVNLTRLDVSFNDTGDVQTIRFYRRKIYYFDLSRSSAVDTTTPITNINAGFLAAIANVGVDTVLQLVMTAPAVGREIQRINDVYTQPLAESDPTSIDRCKLRDPDCTDAFDMALVQWGFYSNSSAFGLEDRTMTQLFPGQFPESPEYSVNRGFQGPDVPSIGITAAKQLLYGPPYGIVALPETFEFFALAVASNNETELLQNFGVTLAQGDAVLAYLRSIGLGPIGKLDFPQAFLQELLDAGGGLIDTRTAHEWLWGKTDPLLEVLSPADSFVYSFFNSTDPSDALAYQGYWEFNTGKYDIIEVNNMTVFDNVTEFNWFSNYTVKVEGNSGTGQFPFFELSGTGSTIDIFPDILLWSSDHGHSIVFKDTAEKRFFFGIKTHVFEIANDTYDPNPNYDLPEGYKGFINSAGWNDRAPVFYSPPHMYLCDPGWLSNFTGIVDPERQRDSSFLYMEPITGLALAGNASLQANTYLEDNGALSTFYPTVRDQTMYPFLWTLQNTELTEDLADLLKSDLFSLLDIAFIIWYTLMALGGFLLIGVCLFFVRERRIVATTGYKSINDD